MWEELWAHLWRRSSSWPTYVNVVGRLISFTFHPQSVHSSVTSYRSALTHTICSANQNDPEERHLLTREDAANQTELVRHGDVTSGINSFLRIFWTLENYLWAKIF